MAHSRCGKIFFGAKVLVWFGADEFLVRFFYLFRRWTEISKELRINEEIRTKEIRLIDNEGEQLGVMSPRDAVKIASERGLDNSNSLEMEGTK